jgi:hypothetical protein
MKRVLAAFVLAMLTLPFCGYAADAGPKVEFNTDNIGPRQIEDLTARNVPRDWGRAWQTLSVALEENRPELLGRAFTGLAKERLATTIAAQKKSGIRTRYIDHGHKLAAYFYSPDGGAMELHDTAQMEIQVLDGNTVVHDENITLHYVGLMTPAADHWEVRLFEAVPKF